MQSAGSLNDRAAKTALTGARALLIAWVSIVAAHAGNEGSGGGRGVLCVDAATGRSSLQLLDIYEARKKGVRFPEKPISPEQAMSVLSFRHESPGGHSFYYPFQDRLKRIRSQVSFLEPGKRLPLVDDIGPVELDPGCRFEQVARYTVLDPYSGAGVLEIDPLLFEELDSLNQTALPVHEVLYQLMKTKFHDPTSVIVRKITASVLAGALVENVYEGIPYREPIRYCTTDFSRLKQEGRSYEDLRNYVEFHVLEKKGSAALLQFQSAAGKDVLSKEIVLLRRPWPTGTEDSPYFETASSFSSLGVGEKVNVVAAGDRAIRIRFPERGIDLPVTCEWTTFSR